MPAARGRRDRIASAVEASRLIEALPPGDQGLWATAFYAGLRRGELQALRGSDIDLKRSEIHVQRSWDQEEGPIPPKSKAGTRTVPLLAVLRSYLEDAAAKPETCLWARPRSALRPKDRWRPREAVMDPGQRKGRREGRASPGASAHDAARVPAHLRLLADRRGRQSQGDPRVHGARDD